MSKESYELFIPESEKDIMKIESKPQTISYSNLYWKYLSIKSLTGGLYLAQLYIMSLFSFSVLMNIFMGELFNVAVSCDASPASTATTVASFSLVMNAISNTGFSDSSPSTYL